MHISNAMLHGSVCPVTAVAAAAGLTAAAWAASKCKTKPTAARFAAVSALVFASQMMNFPVQSGTSGHLLGGVLASVVLGTPFGILSTALVLTVQCLLFSDGGLAVLGANILNMSLVGAGVGGWLAGSLKERSVPTFARIGLAAWVSVVLAAGALSVELALAGAIPFFKCAPMMIGIHALIGVGEALLTVAAVGLLTDRESTSRMGRFVPAVAAMVIALVLSPFACGFPDGLEWVSERFALLHDAAPAFVAPLNGYALPGLPAGGISTALAGLAGVLVVLVAGSLIASSWNRHRAAHGKGGAG